MTTGTSGTTGLEAKAPKYQRIADQLRREIGAGTPGAGQRMPAETELTERFRVSLPTVRQALAVLRAEGLIESRHGIGTFVKEHRKLQRRSRHRYGRARADQKLLTAHLSHEILSAGREPVPPHIAEVLPAGAVDDTGEMVVRRRLLRDNDTGRPEELGASYVPTAIAAGTYLEKPTVVPKALFLCVEELTGTTYAHARDRWEVRMPTARETDLLELSAGASVLHVIHTATTSDDTLLEVSESVWPSERVVLLDEYDIDPHPATDQPASEI